MTLSKKTAIVIFCSLFTAFLASFIFIIKVGNLPYGETVLDLTSFSGLAILSLLISSVVSVFLLWLFSFSVIRPIKEFNRIAKIITSGNLGTRISHVGNDEIGELALNINSITNVLTQSVQTMANTLRDEREKEKMLVTNFAKLEQIRAKDEALLRNLGEGVVAVDQNGYIFLFNDAVSKLTGFSVSEVLGKKYHEILKFKFEKDIGPVPDFISAAFNKIDLKEFPHIQIVSKWGRTVSVTQSTTLITDANLKNYGVIVVLRNITRERELDKLKDEFVSIASHELRTPMTAIKGLISMIFEGDYGVINPQMKEPLSDIASSTQRLIELVNDMLDVSRIEGGRIKYVLSDFKISDLIREIIELMQPLALQKGIELRFSKSDGQETVQADQNKVKQILSNLVGNSLKFTDRGFIEVRYVIHNEHLIVSVRDTGIGIKPENQKMLFSKFAQVTSSQLGRPIGTGLGLYISREFAKKMGGDLWIANSLEGIGSVFSVSLPLSNTQLAKQVSNTIMHPG